MNCPVWLAPAFAARFVWQVRPSLTITSISVATSANTVLSSPTSRRTRT
jgi:hypothetical protein